MDTLEAAKRMINGGICVLHGREYKWRDDRFCSYELDFYYWKDVCYLPQSDDWQIKKEPRKYLKYVWLDERPTTNGSQRFILSHLFGDYGIQWNPTKTEKCNKKYKITIEECPENE